MSAAESYQAFVSLTDRFGGAKKLAGVEPPTHQAKPMAKQKRRFDPRANAPPLVALVEEGDHIQETLFKESAATQLQQHSELGKLSPVKGKWKHSTSFKSNHLNVPEFDALETASTASYSSAYSSKSESLSPTVGSVTELSDIASIDSFLEYDISIRKESIPSNLKAASERPRSANGRIPYADVPDEYYVHGRTKAWNKVIGQWVFEGIPQTYSPSTTRARRLSNEVRIPTPLSTPLGSLENLAASGSRTSLQGGDSCTSLQTGGSCTSLLSSNFDDSEEDYPWNSDAKYKLGKFCHERRKSPAIARTSYKMNASSSCSELDSRLALLDESGEGRDVSKSATDIKPMSTGKHPAEAQHVQIGPVEDGSQTSLSSCKTDDSEKQVTLNSVRNLKYGKFCSDCQSSHSSVSTLSETGSKMSSKSRDVSANTPSTRVKVLRRTVSAMQASSKTTEPEQDTEGGLRYRRPSSSTKWLEAHRKYSTLQVRNQSSKSPDNERGIRNDDTVKQSVEEPAYSSVVEQRAKLFGGTKRGGLRRTKSLHIRAHKSSDKRT